MAEIVIDARKASIAPGFGVKRILPFRKRRMVGPFIFMDHAGPLEVRPEYIATMDVLPHPHIGLSTVSYLLEGQVTHRDSLGTEQIIVPGEINWMTAGKGISHSERFENPDTLKQHELEMIQTWVALPEHIEESNPEFTNYKPEQFATGTEHKIWMRLIAGEAYGLKSDTKTHSPLFYVHLKLETGGKIDLPTGYTERAAYVVHGKVEIDRQVYTSGQMIVFGKAEISTINALENSVVMLLGGEPLGERFIWWNFVSSRKERIEQAKEDWKNGKIILPPNDNKEFIPLPPDLGRPASSGDSKTQSLFCPGKEDYHE